jgi:hypothetical protein
MAGGATQLAHAQTLVLSPTTAEPGTSVTASWRGIVSPTANNWIGLHRAEDPSNYYIDWMFVNCTKTAGGIGRGSCLLSLPAGLAASSYEVRLHDTSSYTILARAAITVTTSARASSVTLAATPATVAAGNSVTASWNSIPGGTGTEWIGLYTPGAASNTYLAWMFVNCTQTASGPRAPGSCSFPIPGNLAAGAYELRLHASSSFTILARSGALSITAAGGGATAGTLTVTAVNASAPTVRVYPADSAGRGDGAASLTRSYGANTRVWLSASLRSGNNYFVKWQRNGVDYDSASTTNIVMNTADTMTAVYETPLCSGISVFPGTDSLRTAVARAPAGSTFCIKPGVHRFTATVTARTGDKYIGETGAILNGSKLLSSFTREGAYWVAANQTQQEPPFPTTTGTATGTYPMCAVATPACIYPEKVFINGQDLAQVTRLADVGPGKFFFDYAADKIYLYDNPTGRSVEATTGSGGIIGFVGGQPSVTIKNLVFEKFGGGDVSGSMHNALKTADGWVVENNEFRFNSYAGIAGFGKPVMRNNYVHHNGKYGVIGDGTLEGNIVSANNIDGFDTNNDAGGSKFHGTRGLMVRGNIFANNNGPAMWADYDNLNTTYENNIVENNSHVGIFHEVSCAAVIRYNVARNNNSVAAGRSLWHGAQIYLRSSKDTQIYGNDVTAAGAGGNTIGLRGGDGVFNPAGCGATELRNIAVRDNVVRMDATDVIGVVGGPPGYAAQIGVSFSNNTYFLSDLSGHNFSFEDRINYFTKEQWQAAGQDTTGRFFQF